MKIETKIKIKEKLKSIGLYSFFKKIYCLKYFQENIVFDFEKKIRSITGRSGKFDYIKKYKDLHKGKRCFIIASGPSLRIEDLERLKNEYTR